MKFKNAGPVLVGALLLTALPLLSSAADLTSAQKQYLEQATTYQAQFEQNLKLATEAAGAGDGAVPASKAKLAMARIQTAKQSAVNVEARLERLPADHEGVKALQASFDETTKSMKALEGRVAGKGGSKPAATPSGKESKLDYQQENTLKIAQGNVDQVSAYADRLDKRLAEFKAVKDKTAISNDAVSAVAADIKEARRRVGFAEDQFKKLPADHSSVKPVIAELTAANARIDAAEKSLEPIYKQAMKQADAGSYPDLKTDNERLIELKNSLAVGNLQFNRAGIAELVKQLPAMKEEVARLDKKYAPLLSQNTGESANLKARQQQFSYSLERFEEAMAKEKQELPKAFDHDLAEVARLTDEAVKENKPLFFTGGIADNLRFAEDKLVLYDALDPAGGKDAAARLAKAREDVKQKQQSLASAIIESNQLPPDRYNGPDKADLIKRATEVLKKARPDAQVLRVCMPSEKWQRDSKWRYENRTWYKIDRSKLQAQVIIKRDDKLAEVHPINLWMDHVNNDEITATPVFDLKEEPEVQNLLLITKVK